MNLIVIYSFDTNCLRYWEEDSPKRVGCYPMNQRGQLMRNHEIHALVRALFRGNDGSVRPYRFHYLQQGKGHIATNFAQGYDSFLAQVADGVLQRTAQGRHGSLRF